MDAIKMTVDAFKPTNLHEKRQAVTPKKRRHLSSEEYSKSDPDCKICVYNPELSQNSVNGKSVWGKVHQLTSEFIFTQKEHDSNLKEEGKENMQLSDQQLNENETKTQHGDEKSQKLCKLDTNSNLQRESATWLEVNENTLFKVIERLPNIQLSAQVIENEITIQHSDEKSQKFCKLDANSNFQRESATWLEINENTLFKVAERLPNIRFSVQQLIKNETKIQHSNSNEKYKTLRKSEANLSLQPEPTILSEINEKREIGENTVFKVPERLPNIQLSNKRLNEDETKIQRNDKISQKLQKLAESNLQEKSTIIAEINENTVFKVPERLPNIQHSAQQLNLDKTKIQHINEISQRLQKLSESNFQQSQKLLILETNLNLQRESLILPELNENTVFKVPKRLPVKKKLAKSQMLSKSLNKPKKIPGLGKPEENVVKQVALQQLKEQKHNPPTRGAQGNDDLHTIIENDRHQRHIKEFQNLSKPNASTTTREVINRDDPVKRSSSINNTGEVFLSRSNSGHGISPGSDSGHGISPGSNSGHGISPGSNSRHVISPGSNSRHGPSPGRDSGQHGSSSGSDSGQHGSSSGSDSGQHGSSSRSDSGHGPSSGSDSGHGSSSGSDFEVRSRSRDDSRERTTSRKKSEEESKNNSPLQNHSAKTFEPEVFLMNLREDYLNSLAADSKKREIFISNRFETLESHINYYTYELNSIPLWTTKLTTVLHNLAKPRDESTCVYLEFRYGSERRIPLFEIREGFIGILSVIRHTMIEILDVTRYIFTEGNVKADTPFIHDVTSFWYNIFHQYSYFREEFYRIRLDYPNFNDVYNSMEGHFNNLKEIFFAFQECVIDLFENCLED